MIVVIHIYVQYVWVFRLSRCRSRDLQDYSLRYYDSGAYLSPNAGRERSDTGSTTLLPVYIFVARCKCPPDYYCYQVSHNFCLLKSRSYRSWLQPLLCWDQLQKFAMGQADTMLTPWRGNLGSAVIWRCSRLFPKADGIDAKIGTARHLLGRDLLPSTICVS